jgi:serine/threonine protein kinase
VSEYIEDLVGKRFGNYILEELIGQAATSRVYKAFHEKLQRYASIKVMHPELTSGLDFVSRFQREAQNMAALSHANISQVYDYDILDGIPYIAMEYIEGKSLNSYLADYRKKNSIIPIGRTLRIIRSVAEALYFAHKKNIVHCDVKPPNILLEDTGRAVLTDFGFAKLVTGATTALSDDLVGTPDYMSPEQCMGKPLRAGSDIYSWGVTMFEMTTGQLPFTSPKPFGVTLMHVNDPPPKPQSINPNLPRRIERIILKALEKDPADRYQTLNQAVQEINKLSEIQTENLPTATLGLRYTSELEPEPQTTSTNLRVTLHFLKTGQIMELPKGSEFTMGRTYENPPNYPDIDLTPFEGYEWGISRMHAKMLVEGDDVKIVDLGSTNGTYFRGDRLKPNVPFQIHHGESINLGQLKIQVLILKED